jgi:hypothetical protein
MTELQAENPAKDKDQGEGRGSDKVLGHDDVILDVATPKGPWTGTFPKTTKVSEVIAAIVKEMGLEHEPFQLIWNGNPLEPVIRPLVSFGLEGEVKLSLVATGSGV